MMMSIAFRIEKLKRKQHLIHRIQMNGPEQRLRLGAAHPFETMTFVARSSCSENKYCIVNSSESTLTSCSKSQQPKWRKGI
jgi:hypothetical protein